MENDDLGMTDDQIEYIALECGFALKPQPDGSIALNPYVYKFARTLLKVQDRVVETQHEVLCEIKEIVQDPNYWTNSDSTAFHRGYILGTIEANMSIEEPDDENPVSELSVPKADSEETLQ